MKTVCDKIIILDDCSTDETPDICRKYGEVFYSDRSYWGFNEVRQRKFQWELATHEKPDWILNLDADETILNIEKLPQMIKTAEQYGCDGLGFRLYDMWNETEYRDDELWCGHYGSWIMAVKYDPKKDYRWCEKELHCGRFPENAVSKLGQTEMKIQHWGWSRTEDRQTKHERYMKADPLGKNGSLAQYESKMDETPNLRRFEG